MCDVGADSPAHKNAGTLESSLATCLMDLGHLIPFKVSDLAPLGSVVSMDEET